MESNKGYGLAILRITIGFLFLLPGIMKFMDPAGIIRMLTDLSFPAPSFLAWILLLKSAGFLRKCAFMKSTTWFTNLEIKIKRFGMCLNV